MRDETDRRPHIAELLTGWRFLFGVSRKAIQLQQSDRLVDSEIEAREIVQGATERVLQDWERLDDALRELLTRSAYQVWIEGNEMVAELRRQRRGLGRCETGRERLRGKGNKRKRGRER